MPEKSTKRNSFIRLSLRKPKDWRVALTTSVSSPAIVPPEIQLWDEEQGDVLLDTSQNCVRSKSASFTRLRAPSSENRTSQGKPQDQKSPRKPINNKDSSLAVNGSQVRSKSLSTRERADGLVKPEEYERPPTPVMVARRISLAKDSSVKVSPNSTSQVNGIVTHWKQNSDSSSVGSRRKVRHNVSFGRVDTIDDSSSISSSFSLSKSKRTLLKNSVSSPRSSSSPRIVITEIVDTSGDSEAIKRKRDEKEKIKHRSRSGIPVLSGNREITGNSLASKIKLDQNVNVNENCKPGRKSRMELYMSQQIGKHKFTVTRVPENTDPVFNQIRPSGHHCERGNCPLDKYLAEAPRGKTSKGGTPEEMSFPSTHTGRSMSRNALLRDGSSGKEKRPGDGPKKREGSRRRRVASRSRQEVMSLSSSDSEGCLAPRTPPRRRRWSRTPKGDRLVGVNGSCVRTPRQAEDKLRHSPDVVYLQLRRQDALSRSLPRHGLDEDMGSNMSRPSGKGLTGRRSQSSGNLCNGKVSAPVSRFFSPCGGNDQRTRDRYKFCGSLPNHLDSNETADTDEYRNNNNVKDDVVLRLQPLVSKGEMPLDQGYGSERSPEEEVVPDLPPASTVSQLTCPVHHPGAKPVYPFLHKNSTFTVTLVKGTRGLGLSVTGGVDTEEPWPGLIRVKRLFPHQPAWQSGQLASGDFLLVVNNTSLVGLTNYEALEVLRTTPAEVVLTVCRPPPELQVLNAPPPTESVTAPPPPRRDNPPSTSASSLQLPLKRMESFGEFELMLKKVNGSLGFTLRKEDESILGHYVRALVREPALSDGRIKPGDKIVTVNGVDMSPMSHEEAVLFLRQCGQEVHLRLYRDPAQTPVQALSPTEHHRTIKPILRKEAQDMLSDLAVKKSMSPNESSGSSSLSKEGRTSSPRKRRLTKTPSPDLGRERLDNHLSWSDEVLERISPGSDPDKPKRPDTLNFAAERKPNFQFSAVSKTEENLASLDSLDCGSVAGDLGVGVGPLPSEPVSMPPLLSATSDTTVGFSYRNPAYRSANPAPSKSKSSLSEDLPENRCSDNDLTTGVMGEDGGDGSKGLLKWKGVVFTPDDGADNASATSPDDSISQITEIDSSNNQVLVVELNRGWNSRLGFSLQQSGRNTLISAIHPDSVASRDGRLRVGDQLIMVNDESIEGMTTAEVIDLLRKIRGSICITVWRKPSQDNH